MSQRKSKKVIKGAVIGYGAAFNMGKAHADMMNRTEGIECVAVCDIDKARTDAAKKDFPAVQTYNGLDKMLKDCDFDLAAIVLPHSLHAAATIQCLEAKRHVVVEKPMCLTIAEATEMINTAKANGVMLSVHHNRRWDADFWTLRQLVKSGVIGEIFQVEMWGGGYGKPDPKQWRSVKRISGGAFYDWGAHYLDWLLNVIESKMINITGFFHKRVWHDISNEDHVHAIIRFSNGVVADVQMSHIAKLGKPRWWMLGTHGAIISEKDQFRVLSEVEGQPKEQTVGYQRRGGPSYYQNVVAHLQKGEELIVKPEEARRVIAIMELAEKSSKTHQAETVPYEF